MDKVDCSFLAELLDSLDSAVVLADEAGWIFIRNSFAEKLLGEITNLSELWCRMDISHSAKEAAGKGDSPVSYPEFRAMPCMALCHGLTGSIAVRLQVLHLGGSGVVAIVAAPVPDATAFGQAGTSGMSGTSKIDSRGEDAARHATAKVAHEVNNPLDGMGRFLNLAARAVQNGQNDKAVEFIQRAGDGVTRLKGVVSRMLDRSETGDVEHSKPQLAAIQIQQAIDVMTPAITSASVALVCDMDLPGDAAVSPGMFGIVCNLIKNACDAMPDGGRLMLRTRISGGELVLSVADTGPGIAPELGDRIFEPFYTTKDDGEGSGLGLAVSRRQALEAGGQLDCQSGDESGAFFTLRLPIISTRLARRKLS